MLTVPSRNGKVTVEDIRPHIIRGGDQHYAQPAALSIAQPTELGTVYTIDALRELSQFARENGLGFHIDGARLVNAAAALNTTLRALTTDIGADIISFGGAKNGLLVGEAVVVLNPKMGQSLKYRRKQAMQLPSKTRFIAAQFCEFFKDDLWREIATHANGMASLLASKVEDIPNVELCYPADSNAVFARIPKDWVKPLRRDYFFYVWNEQTTEVRWMTSFDTTRDDIEGLADALRARPQPGTGPTD